MWFEFLTDSNLTFTVVIQILNRFESNFLCYDTNFVHKSLNSPSIWFEIRTFSIWFNSNLIQLVAHSSHNIYILVNLILQTLYNEDIDLDNWAEKDLPNLASIFLQNFKEFLESLVECVENPEDFTFLMGINPTLLYVSFHASKCTFGDFYLHFLLYRITHSLDDD